MELSRAFSHFCHTYLKYISVLVFSFVIIACGGGGDGVPDPNPTPTGSARLMSLTISEGEFDTPFAPTNQVLRVNLDSTITEVTFTAIPEDSAATMTINDLPLVEAVPSVPVLLNVGENRIDIEVSSADGSVIVEYNIIVTRQAGATIAEQAYLKASNSDPDDFFGYQVAVSGNTVAVAAIGEQSNGSQADNSLEDAGAVYIYVRDPSGNWSQQAYIKAPSPMMDDGFGIALALSGDTLVVGGADVHVYQRNGGSWSFEETLIKPVVTIGTSDFTPPGFGLAVAIEGDVIAVGAFGESSDATGVNGDESSIIPGVLNSGAVYIYERQVVPIAGLPLWPKTHYIKASNTGENDAFGTAIAMDGNTLIVGAPGEASDSNLVGGNQADDSVPGAGAAYIFVRANLGSWSQQAYLKASNSDALDDFGSAVDVSGDTVVVGARLENSSAQSVNGNDTLNDSSDAGAAYAYVRDISGIWSQQAYLKASKTRSFYEFGHDVAISGSQIMVGSVREGSGVQGINSIPETGVDLAPLSGATYLYNRSGTEWSLDAYVKASNAQVVDAFGISVDIDNGLFAVGAFSEFSDSNLINAGQSDNSAPGAGAVYVFE